jgi:opacity protein-like surface antigen
MLNRKLMIAILTYITTVPAFAWVNNGIYLGGEIGVNNQIIDFNNSAFNVNGGNASLSGGNSGFMGRVNLGYQFNSYSALEFGENYAWNSDYQFPNDWGVSKIRNNFIDLSYLLSLPITQSYFSAFGRVGATYNWVGSSGSNLSVTGGAVSSEVGAGLKYNATKYVNLRLEWIANGLWQPVGVSANGQQVGKLSSQNFLFGSNYYF